MVQSIEQTRVHCDALFLASLKAEQELVVKLTTAAGQPLSNAKVYPASHHGILFPLCIPTTSQGTNEDGEVKLRESHPDALTGLVAEHPTIGKQRIAVSRSADGKFIAQAASTRKVFGRIRSTDETPIPGLDQVKLLVFSCDMDKFQYPNTPTYCGWDFVSVAADGSFAIPQLSAGHLMHRISCPATFAWREKNAYEYDRLELADDASYEWELEFQEEPRISVTILEEDSDRPLPNLHISTYDGRLENTTTDQQGKASFYRIGPRASYFPTDPTGEYFSQDSFYQYAKTPPINNVVEFPPYTLSRRVQWEGRVVDEEGEPHPGARVTYEYSMERFTRTDVVYSNSDGSFSLRGVSDLSLIHI